MGSFLSSLGGILGTAGKTAAKGIGAAGKAISKMNADSSQPKRFPSHPSEPVNGGAGSMAKTGLSFRKALREAGRTVSLTASGRRRRDDNDRDDDDSDSE